MSGGDNPGVGAAPDHRPKKTPTLGGWRLSARFTSLETYDVRFPTSREDPDDYFDIALREAYPALRDLRDAGVLRAIGAGMNQWQMLERFIESCDFDVVLLAGRYTLLDRSAGHTLLPRCLERNVAVVAGSIFNSGILAQAAPGDDATYDYAPASPAVLVQARALARACQAHGATLPHAALQFPFRNAAVSGVLVGMRDAEEVRSNVAAFARPLPAELWDELDRIVEGAALH